MGASISSVSNGSEGNTTSSSASTNHNTSGKFSKSKSRKGDTSVTRDHRCRQDSGGIGCEVGNSTAVEGAGEATDCDEDDAEMQRLRRMQRKVAVDRRMQRSSHLLWTSVLGSKAHEQAGSSGAGSSSLCDGASSFIEATATSHGKACTRSGSTSDGDDHHGDLLPVSVACDPPLAQRGAHNVRMMMRGRYARFFEAQTHLYPCRNGSSAWHNSYHPPPPPQPPPLPSVSSSVTAVTLSPSPPPSRCDTAKEGGEGEGVGGGAIRGIDTQKKRIRQGLLPPSPASGTCRGRSTSPIHPCNGMPHLQRSLGYGGYTSPPSRSSQGGPTRAPTVAPPTPLSETKPPSSSSSSLASGQHAPWSRRQSALWTAVTTTTSSLWAHEAMATSPAAESTATTIASAAERDRWQDDESQLDDTTLEDSDFEVFEDSDDEDDEYYY